MKILWNKYPQSIPRRNGTYLVAMEQKNIPVTRAYVDGMFYNCENRHLVKWKPMPAPLTKVTHWANIHMPGENTQ